MRSLKSGLVTFAVAGLFATAAIVGCSADGGSGIASDTTPTEQEPDAVLPPPSGGGNTDSGTTTPPKKDGGTKTDSGVDAGPPPPVPGTACKTDGAKASKPCGACGTQEAVCLDEGTGLKWTEYGVCGNELTGGCIPGTTVDEPCGNCGTVKKTCTKYCAYTSGACTGQPAMSCKPGTTEYITAGCTTPSTYRNRTCGAACTWGSFTTVCAQPVNDIVLTMPSTVGATASTTITFSTAKMGPRISAFGACPQAAALSAGDYPQEYVEIKNPTAQAAKVSVFTSQAPGGAVIDTMMAGYAVAIQPMSDTERKACSFGANDQSTDVALTGNVDFSLIKAVPIPAGGSILLFVSTYYDYDAATPEETTGPLNVNVKVESLL